VNVKTIHKTLKIESDVIRIPELKEFMGKEVEVIITEKLVKKDKKNQMKHFLNLAGKIDIDEEAIYRLREESKI